MIIYGTRMYGKKDVVKGWGFCDQCGRYGRNSSYSGRKWGHLYFIPLIPSGPRVRVVKECKACSQGLHFPEKELPNILADLHKNTQNALSALVSGEKQFNDNGTMIPATGCLSGSVDILHCLQADDYLNHLLSAMKENNLTHTYHLVNGESLEFHGKLDQAIESYNQAALCEPGDAIVLISLGSIYMKKNDFITAKEFYECALELSEERFPVLQVLLTIYESIKDYSKVAETYEECFEIIPELAKDKKVFKAYKRTCKKAGKTPIVG